jgi:hypothetical protein
MIQIVCAKDQFSGKSGIGRTDRVQPDQTLSGCTLNPICQLAVTEQAVLCQRRDRLHGAIVYHKE